MVSLTIPISESNFI